MAVKRELVYALLTVRTTVAKLSKLHTPLTKYVEAQVTLICFCSNKSVWWIRAATGRKQKARKAPLRATQPLQGVVCACYIQRV